MGKLWHMPIIFGLLAPLMVLTQEAPKNRADKRPNIIFIVVDDLGWADVGYQGSTFHETPNIDSLAVHSVQFSNAYAASSVCSPSRAALLTGMHPSRLHITDWIPGDDPQDRLLRGPQDLHELPLPTPTLAEGLRQRGYETLFAGKWHLGGDGFLPQDQGFHVNKGGYHVGQPPGGYYVPYENPYLLDGPQGEYLTDRLTDEGIAFMETVSDAPFFLYLNYYTVHTPIQPNLSYVDYFERKKAQLGDGGKARKQERGAWTNLVQNDASYASMLYALDKNLGRLIAYLKTNARYDDTIIVFTSDNGGLSTLEAGHSLVAPTSNAPLRAGKGWLYEGGIRVPLLIKPAEPGFLGTKVDDPVVGQDLMPTLLAETGYPGYEDLDTDGMALGPLWKGGDWFRDHLVWHYPHYHGSGWTPGAAIRRGDWKLLYFYETGRAELYHLKNDVSEANDRAKDQPQRLATMLGLLREHGARVGAQIPTGK